jgi:hypothetical protein
MSKFVLSALACLLIVLSAGCGGEEAPVAAKVGDPESLLIGIGELSEATASGKTPPNACGPALVLRKDEGRTALSKTFVVGATQVAEAVGVFRAPAKAQSAYKDLISRERIGCIASAIGSFGSTAKIEIIRAQSLDIGDAGSAYRYVALDEDSEPRGYSDVVALRIGRCTAALLIAIERDEPPNAVAEEATETAAGRLSTPCG